MQDRVPASGMAGRVLITPEDGSAAFYAKIARADNPTQKGDPLNKSTLLTDSTAGLFGLDETAVPDDVLEILSNFIPSPYGLLAIRAADSEGNPVSTVFDLVFPDGTTEAILADDFGSYRRYLEPGTYTLNANQVFHRVTPATVTVEIKPSRTSIVTVQSEKNESGEYDIDFSRDVPIPTWIESVDIFVVGGGGSGAAATSGTGYYPKASGGAGGYTETILGQALSGKVLKVSIGAGGEPIHIDPAESQSSYARDYENGNDGGTTSVTVDGVEIISAKGGNGGSANAYSDRASYCSGEDGGSGSGGCYYMMVGDPGSDGSNGYNSSGDIYDGTSTTSGHGGKGQGTTTRKFGESEGELFSGAGGSAAGYYNTDTCVGVQSAGAEGGGGDGFGHHYASNAPRVAGDATNYGGGGGAIAIKCDESQSIVTSGAGYQGLASIRWGVAA